MKNNGCFLVTVRSAVFIIISKSSTLFGKSTLFCLLRFLLEAMRRVTENCVAQVYYR